MLLVLQLPDAGILDFPSLHALIASLVSSLAASGSMTCPILANSGGLEDIAITAQLNLPLARLPVLTGREPL